MERDGNAKEESAETGHKDREEDREDREEKEEGVRELKEESEGRMAEGRGAGRVAGGITAEERAGMRGG